MTQICKQKTAELYTLNGWVVWYVNFILIELLKNVSVYILKNIYFAGPQP